MTTTQQESPYFEDTRARQRAILSEFIDLAKGALHDPEGAALGLAYVALWQVKHLLAEHDPATRRSRACSVCWATTCST